METFKVGKVTLHLELEIKAGNSTAVKAMAKTWVQDHIEELPFQVEMREILTEEEQQP